MNGSGLLCAVSLVTTAVALRHASRSQGPARRGALLRQGPAGAATGHPPVRVLLGGESAPPTSGGRPLLSRAGNLAPAPPWVVSALAEADLSIDPARAWSLWLAAVPLAGTAGLAAGGVGAAAVAVGAVVAAPVVGWRLVRRRGSDRYEAALPAAVEAVARALRSGASLRLAVAEAAAETAGSLGTDLERVARTMDRGASVVVALEAWAERRPTPGVRLVVSALCLGAETGGALARAVDGVASTLRQRLAARAEARALATQARASAAVLAAAPVAFTAVASLADTRTSTFLFRTPTGLLCVAAGLALDAAGALWMARLTRIEAD